MPEKETPLRMHTRRKGLARTQRDSSCRQMERRGLRMKPISLTPWSWTSKAVKKYISHIKTTQFLVSYNGSPSELWCRPPSNERDIKRCHSCYLRSSCGYYLVSQVKCHSVASGGWPEPGGTRSFISTSLALPSSSFCSFKVPRGLINHIRLQQGPVQPVVIFAISDLLLVLTFVTAYIGLFVFWIKEILGTEAWGRRTSRWDNSLVPAVNS